MKADHGTSRYYMNKMRRTKTATPAGNTASGKGTNRYTPMFTNTQTKDMGSIRSNNTTEYHMMDSGGKAKLIPRKKVGGDCGCKGGKLGKSFKLLYNGSKR